MPRGSRAVLKTRLILRLERGLQAHLGILCCTVLIQTVLVGQSGMLRCKYRKTGADL